MLKPIPGWEDRYLVDRKGNVWSTLRNQWKKHSVNENGYVYVTLTRDNKSCSRAVHRLVAETHIPNPDGKPNVNHIDADRTNYHADNLEWCTQSENISHAYHLGNRTAKKNFTEEETEWLLQQFLNGESMTSLANRMKIGLSRLTINLRNHAWASDAKETFEAELKRQKTERNRKTNEARYREVIQLTLDGEEVQRFPSVGAAARAHGLTTSGPIANAAGPNPAYKSSAGYLWKYA